MKVSRYMLALVVLVILAMNTTTLSAQSYSHKLIVIAHRGDHTDAPENTLKAFQDAITTGVDYVEVDVRTSSDGELVVMHDATVNRMTDTTGNVDAFTLLELQKLKVKDKQRPGLGAHQIPTLAEVLHVCEGKMGIYLDFKSGDVEKTWQLIRKYRMEGRVVVYINEAAQLQQWRSRAPDVPLMISLPDSVRDATTYQNFQRSVDAQILDGSAEDYTKALVEVINRSGRQVWIDVQAKDESARRWRKAKTLGVQGMQTDHPRELLIWRDQRSLK